MSRGASSLLVGKRTQTKQETMADANDPNRKKLPGAKDQGDRKDLDEEKDALALKSIADSDDGNDGWGRKRGGGAVKQKTKGTWKFARRTLATPIPAKVLKEEKLLPTTSVAATGKKLEGLHIDSTPGTAGEGLEGKQVKGGKDQDSRKGD